MGDIFGGAPEMPPPPPPPPAPPPPPPTILEKATLEITDSAANDAKKKRGAKQILRTKDQSLLGSDSSNSLLG